MITFLRSIIHSATDPTLMAQPPKNGSHDRGNLITLIAAAAIATVATAASYCLSEPSLETSLQRWIDAASAHEKPARELAAKRIKECHDKGDDTLDLKNIPITSLKGVPLPTNLRVLMIEGTQIDSLTGVQTPSTLMQIDNLLFGN